MWGETKRWQPALWAIAGVAAIMWTPPASSDTLEGALVLAYQNNPTLNAQRASVRATDEGVPQALAGYRPRVTFNGTRCSTAFRPRTAPGRRRARCRRRARRCE